MAQPALHILQLVFDLLEDGRVRLKADKRPVRLRRLALLLTLQLALLEGRLKKLALTMTPHRELPRQRVHRFRTDAVQTHAELEHLVIVLRTRIDLGNAIDDFAQRDAPAEITHRDTVPLDGDLHLA